MEGFKNIISKGVVPQVDDSVKGVLTLMVNAFDVEDAQHDISAKGSFSKTIKENFDRWRWLYNHDTTQLLGCPLKAWETSEGLMVQAQINTEKQLGRDVLSDYILYAENGRTLEHSVGVQAIKRDERDSRIVKEWRLWEFSSLACWGANPATYCESIKSRQDIKDELAFLSKAVKADYSDERLRGIEQKISILEKALGNDEPLLVKCPYCGKEFDYNAEAEHTFTDDVLNIVRCFVSDMTWDSVREQMQSADEEVRNAVTDIIGAIKSGKIDMTSKDITSVMNYVRCPDCWSRVYKIDSVISKSEKPLPGTSQRPAESSLFRGMTSIYK